MLYAYQKATPENPTPGKLVPPYLKTIPTIVSALGLGLIASVVWPIFSYQLNITSILQSFSPSGLLSPINYESYADETTIGPIVLSDIDYNHAGNWFAISGDYDYSVASSSSENVDQYAISIPTLGITSAKVSTKDDDLTKALVQYHQTAYPGQWGSPVIFGHSTLPQFFDPQKYTTIFSTLPEIKIGSDIIVDFANTRYTYRVTRLFEVKPTDLWVLRQEYNQKTLKLITCVPPGTKIKRLVVEAELTKL